MSLGILTLTMKRLLGKLGLQPSAFGLQPSAFGLQSSAFGLSPFLERTVTPKRQSKASLHAEGLRENLHRFLFIRILFIRTTGTRLRFGPKYFRKWRNIGPLQKQNMSNETVCQEKHFKRIIGGRGEWEITQTSPRI